MSGSKIRDSQAHKSETDNLLIKLRDEFDKAEKLAKKVEEFRDEAGLPAINELRYAGYHAIVFASSNVLGANADSGQLISAINHCRRAAYEAGEAGIISALDQIDRFKSYYAGITVGDTVKNWNHMLQRCDEVRDMISAGRATDDDRTVDHELYAKCFDELVAFCRSLKYATDDMETKVVKLQKSTRNFILGTILALLGVILTIVFGVLPFFMKP